jgi:hypothetical protein
MSAEPSCGELEGSTLDRRPHPMSTNQQRAGARRVLGPDHPLARMTAQLSVATERCLAVSVVLAIGLYALVHDLSIAASLTVGAATVLAALLARVGALVGSRDRRAVELIAEGRGELPVEAVVRARQRLLDPAERERLARTLDVIRAEVGRPPGECHSIPPLYSVPVVRAVSSELGEVARLVREGGGLRGLAGAEQLVTDGRSPLYGDVEVVLRQELGRICFLLVSRDADRAPEWGSLPISGRAPLP